MSFNYNQINLDALTSMPVKVKEAFPDDSVKWEAMNRYLISRIKSGESKEILIDGEVFLVTKIKDTK